MRRMPTLTGALDELAREGEAELLAQGIEQSAIEIERHVHIKYAGTDAPLLAAFGDVQTIKASFEDAHRRQYGFIVPDKALIVDSVSIEAIGRTEAVADPVLASAERADAEPKALVPFWAEGAHHQAPVLERAEMRPGQEVSGPAIILETTSTTIVEPGWTRGGDRARASGAGAAQGAGAAGGDRHQCRSGDAGDLQQPLHVDRRADGLDPGEDQLLGEHQGAAGFLLRPVRPAGPADRQRAAHAGASGLDGRDRWRPSSTPTAMRPANPPSCRATSTC